MQKDYAAGLRQFLGPPGLKIETRGRKPGENSGRDQRIAEIVQKVCEESGLKPTRHQPTKKKKKHRKTMRRESGCSIVHAGLARIGYNMTERNVEKIWQRRNPTAKTGVRKK
jgi:hypothetical protein